MYFKEYQKGGTIRFSYMIKNFPPYGLNNERSHNNMVVLVHNTITKYCQECFIFLTYKYMY